VEVGSDASDSSAATIDADANPSTNHIPITTRTSAIATLLKTIAADRLIHESD